MRFQNPFLIIRIFATIMIIDAMNKAYLYIISIVPYGYLVLIKWTFYVFSIHVVVAKVAVWFNCYVHNKTCMGMSTYLFWPHGFFLFVCFHSVTIALSCGLVLIALHEKYSEHFYFLKRSIMLPYLITQEVHKV